MIDLYPILSSELKLSNFIIGGGGNGRRSKAGGGEIRSENDAVAAQQVWGIMKRG